MSTALLCDAYVSSFLWLLRKHHLLHSKVYLPKYWKVRQNVLANCESQNLTQETSKQTSKAT